MGGLGMSLCTLILIITPTLQESTYSSPSDVENDPWSPMLKRLEIGPVVIPQIAPHWSHKPLTECNYRWGEQVASVYRLPDLHLFCAHCEKLARSFLSSSSAFCQFIYNNIFLSLISVGMFRNWEHRRIEGLGPFWHSVRLAGICYLG